MTVNLEVKGTLAKLLATEDIVVEHREVETAQFDVENRVLTLPIWDASNYVFDMLVGHEVSHALFTPNEDWTEKCKAPQQFVNVCEDVRVEKLMKDKYLGIAKTFYRGYSELHAKDFFEVGDQDVNSFNLADKINLHAKIGAFLGVKFTPQEQEIVNVVENAKTFEDTLAAAETLYNFCKANQPDDQNQEGTEGVQLPMGGVEDSGDSDDDGSDSDESPVSSSNSSDDVEGGSDSDSSDTGMDDNGSPLDEDDVPSLDVETAKSLGGNLQKIAQKPVRNNTYIEKPHIIPDEVIVRNEEISDFCEEFWNRIYSEPLNKKTYTQPIDEELLKIKKEAEKEVNYLVKEFECRKSAAAYARAATARTGVLDTTKLHTYKYNDDIFKKVTVLPDGKNHGLLFLLDWSGSMHECLGATVKQLLNLVWFCKKVNIPFRVYGFTNCYFVNNEDDGRYYNPSNNSLIKEQKRNEVFIPDSYRLLEFLSSEGNIKEFDRQIRTFWRLTCAMARDVSHWIDAPQRFHLSGTPLDTSLVVLHNIIPQFKKKYDLQKVQAIILTDGESEPLSYSAETENPYTFDRKLFCRPVRSTCTYLRDRKLGTTYRLSEWTEGTAALMQHLQDSFPDVNFIGIRLAGNSTVQRLFRANGIYDEKISNRWRKEKAISLPIGNYTKFFALSTNEMNKEVEFDPDANATKAQIRSAFKKSLNKSKFNRKILSEFVELVA